MIDAKAFVAQLLVVLRMQTNRASSRKDVDDRMRWFFSSVSNDFMLVIRVNADVVVVRKRIDR